MTKSPCLSCHNRNKNKSNDECLRCSSRIEYVLGIGDLISPLPIKSIPAFVKPKENPFMNFEKYCNTCKANKPTTEFGNKASNPDGKELMCKKCKSEYDKTRKAIRMAKKKGIPMPEEKLIAPPCFPLDSHPLKREQPEPIERPSLPVNVIPNIQVDIMQNLFEGYPEMLEHIQKMAIEQFRDPRRQVLFMLNQSLEAQKS